MDSLVAVPCQRSEQGFSHQGTEGTLESWIETAEPFSAPTDSLFFLPCCLPALKSFSWSRKSSHWTWVLHKYTGPENSEKAPCFPFQVCETASLLPSNTPSHQAHAHDWTENCGRTHSSNRVEVVPQSQTKPKPLFFLGKCFVWERTRSLSPSPEPVLAPGIVALEWPSLLHTKPKEQSMPKLMKGD